MGHILKSTVDNSLASERNLQQKHKTNMASMIYNLSILETIYEFCLSY